MGCDIHWHAEIKIRGSWEHYTTWSISRNYRLFAKMAGVRNQDDYQLTPLSEPKGMPKDCTRMTRFDCKEWGTDGHSHSWLNADEIKQLAEWGEAAFKTKLPWWEAEVFGWLFGNTWSGFAKYPEDRKEGVEDIRWIFWFDN